MSRRHQLTRTPLRWAALVVASGLTALTLSSCGAGQITQTDTQVAAVDGANQDIGTIALRDVLLPYPDNATGSYSSGVDVPLQVTIVNGGNKPDTLVAVRTPGATRVVVQGRTTIPPGTSVVSVIDESTKSAKPSASATPQSTQTSASAVPGAPPSAAQGAGPSAVPGAAPSQAPGVHDTAAPSTPPGAGSVEVSPLDVGELRIVLIDTTRPLRAGINTPITFVFRNAGAVTLPVPIGSSGDTAREPQKESGGHS